MMSIFALALACLAFAGHGHRVLTTRQRSQGALPEHGQTSDEARRSQLIALEQLRFSVQCRQPKPSASLAILALALNEPLAAWQILTHSCHSALATSAGTSVGLLPSRGVPPIMKRKGKMTLPGQVEMRKMMELQYERQQERLIRKQEQLMAGERTPKTVEELYAVLEKKVGKEEAQKFIAARALQVVQKRTDIELGQKLPMPKALEEWESLPRAFTWQELTKGKDKTILIADREMVLSDRMREVLREFNRERENLNVALIGVCAASVTGMRKFVRRNDFTFPLISDLRSEWLKMLNVREGTKNQILVFIIDSKTQAVIGFFDGAGTLKPSMIVQNVATTIKFPPEPTFTEIQEVSSVPAPAPQPPRVEAAPASSPPSTQAVREVPDEWKFAAGVQSAPPKPAVQNPADWEWAKTAEGVTGAAAPVAPVVPVAPGAPAVGVMGGAVAPVVPDAPAAPAAPVAPDASAAPAAPAEPATLSPLEEENRRLRQELLEAKQMEASSKLEAENAAMKAALREAQAMKFANDAAVKAAEQANLAAEKAVQSASSVAEKKRKEAAADYARKAEAESRRLRAQKDAAKASAAAEKAEKAELLATIQKVKDDARKQAEAEKAALRAQLNAVQQAAQAEKEKRQAAEQRAKFEHDQAVAAGAAAQEAAEAAAKAATAAAELAAKQAAAPATRLRPPFQGQGLQGRQRLGVQQQQTPAERRQYMLPGVFKLSKLLNGTEGILQVNVSGVQGSPIARYGGGGYGIVNKGGRGSGEVQNAGLSKKLVIKIQDGAWFSGFRLAASLEDTRGKRTQLLYLRCTEEFTLTKLKDLLRALQPAFDFIFDETADDTLESRLASELLKDLNKITKEDS